MQPVVKTVEEPVKHWLYSRHCITDNRLINRLHRVRCCDQHEITYVCKTPFTPFNRLSNKLLVKQVVEQPRLHRANKHSAGCPTGCLTVEWCKRGLTHVSDFVLITTPHFSRVLIAPDHI